MSLNARLSRIGVHKQTIVVIFAKVPDGSFAAPSIITCFMLRVPVVTGETRFIRRVSPWACFIFHPLKDYANPPTYHKL